MAQQQRSYDIGIVGASGYTGLLVMEYLGKLKTGLKILASSRNPDRLAKITGDLDSSIKVWPKSVDSNVFNSLVEFVSQAKVIIACAGPFYNVGISVVKACVETGTHYVDITGEVDFMRHIIDVFGAQARIKNSLVIPSCGFDSVPSDMGVFCLQKAAPSALLRATAYVVLKGTFSGGTLRTIFTSGMNTSRKAVLNDVYALNERLDKTACPGKLPSKFDMDPRCISFDHDLHKWLSPSAMATINTRVVRRTVSLSRVHPEHQLNFHHDFMYREVSQSSSILRAVIPIVISLALSTLKWVFKWSIFQRMLSWLIPAPGTTGGPSREQRKQNFSHYRFIGTCHNDEKVEVQFHGKDSYEVTAETVTQAALCILENEQSLLQEHNGGGVFTPAYALGEKYLSRFATSELVKFSSKGQDVKLSSKGD